jgi:hypothetical protein
MHRAHLSIPFNDSREEGEGDGESWSEPVSIHVQAHAFVASRTKQVQDQRQEYYPLYAETSRPALLCH